MILAEKLKSFVPRHFKFSRMAAPVSTKQEENLRLKQVTLVVESRSEDQDEDVYKVVLKTLG